MKELVRFVFFYSEDESLLVLYPIFKAIEELGNDFLVVEFFMTDKNASERNPIKKFFKDASLILCYFHSVKAFEAAASHLSHRIGFDYLKKYINDKKVNGVIKNHI